VGFANYCSISLLQPCWDFAAIYRVRNDCGARDKCSKEVPIGWGHHKYIRVVPSCSQYWEPKRQSTTNQNPSRKLTRKLESEMPIAFVDWQLNDNSRVVDPLLAEAAPSCCWSTVKSGSSDRHFFMSNRSWQTRWKKIVDAFDLIDKWLNIFLEHNI